MLLEEKTEECFGFGIDVCSWPWVVKGISSVVSGIGASVVGFYGYHEWYF